MEDIKLGVKEMEHSYSGYGWKGINCDMNLSMKDMAKLIRQELKKKYPDAKFSVRIGGNCYCSTISVDLMADTTSPFNTFDDAVKEAEKRCGYNKMYYDYSKWAGLSERDIAESEENKKHLRKRLEGGIINVNKYYISEDHELSAYGKEMFTYIKDLLDSFNYDDSDSMTDYYNCGFYMDLGIGRYGRPFELKEKKEDK